MSLLTDLVIFFNNYLSFFSLTYLFHLGDQINRHQVQNFGLLYLWQLPFILTGLYFIIKTKNIFLRSFILFLLLVGPIAPSFARPSPHTLRFLLGSVAFTLLTILGILQVLTNFKKEKLKFMVGIISFMSVAGFVYYVDYYFVHYPVEAQIDWGGQCKQLTTIIKNDAPKYDAIIVDKNVLCIPDYFSFYIPEVRVQYVSSTWKNDPKDEKKRFLYVRPYYGNPKPDKILENVYLTNRQRDIFAQIYKL